MLLSGQDMATLQDQQAWTQVMPIGDLPVRGRALWPNREAVVFPEERLNYTDLAERAERAARSLRALGVGPGDHVGILLPNSLEFVSVLYGVATLGAVAVLINSRYQGGDLAHVVVDADLKLLVTCEYGGDPVRLLQRLEQALPGLARARSGVGFAVTEAPRLRGVVVLGDPTGPAYVGPDAFAAAADQVAPAEVHQLRRQVAIRDIGMMMYTSGTTAQPKGCLMSHEMVVRNGIAGGVRLDVREGDRFWDPLPMFHMSAILPMTACFSVGATFMSMKHFEAGPALDMMERERTTHAYPTFPTITQALANHERFRDADLSDVRLVNNVAPPATLRQLQELWPKATLVTAYGSTETGGCTSFSEITDTLDQRVETCGRPFPGIQMRVADPETGRTVPAGERGEICVRGYSLFEGYYKAPEQTAEKIDADGWFHTGDIGCQDADGRVSYLGRLKDMLKVGGENVAAVEIEALLQNHPAVSIAQVVGVPDDRLVEVPAAFVELRPGASVDPDELLAWARGKVASFKLPHYIRVVTEWPVAATKIQKFRLREQLCRELGIECA